MEGLIGLQEYGGVIGLQERFQHYCFVPILAAHLFNKREAFLSQAGSMDQTV